MEEVIFTTEFLSNYQSITALHSSVMMSVSVHIGSYIAVATQAEVQFSC